MKTGFTRAARRGAAIFLALGLILPSFAFAEDDDRSVLSSVFDAWAKRQETVRSLRIEWTQRLTIRKVAISFVEEVTPRTAPGNSTEPADQPKPGDLVTVTQRNILLLDGERFSYQVDTDGGKTLDMPPHCHCTYDGSTSQMYAVIEPDDPGLGTGNGVVRNEPYAFAVDSTGLRPLLLAFRGADPVLARVDPADFRIAPNRGVIDDVSCIIVEHAGQQQPHLYFWVDPARDHAVLREHETYNGVDRIQKDISYQNDPEFGRIPSAWKIVNLDEQGNLRESAEATVTSYAINTSIPLSDFQITFPNGTYLVEGSGPNAQASWIGGKPRGKYQAGDWSRRSWLVVVNVVAICVLAVFYFVGRKRRRGAAVVLVHGE
jgi:hypothetical protein